MSKLHVYFIAACLATLIACGAKKEEQAKEAEAVTPVEVATVKREAIHQVVSAAAVLFPVAQANVTTKIAAPVRRFLVNRGDHVRAGQVLAILEDRDLLAAAQESKSLFNQTQSTFQTITGATMPDEFTRAQTDVQSARQALDAAQRLYDNRVSLVKQGALAQKLADDAKVTLVQAQSQAETAQRHLQSMQSVGRPEQVKGAQAQVDAAKAHYESAQAQVSYAEVRSPISGVVSDRPSNAGEMASPGAALISIVDISQVVARANVPVKDAATVRVGRPATINGPGGQLTGKVTVISPAVDPATTTVEIWVQATNRGELLKPGVSVNVDIAASTIGDALVVPASALLSLEEGGDKVMVVGGDSLAHEQKVEIGVREGDRVQLLSGIKEGDQVITSGGLGLEDKAKVKIGSGKEDDKEEKKDDKKDEKK